MSSLRSNLAVEELHGPPQVKPGRLKPFLKWAGGKTQLVNVLLKHVPPEYGKYIEPFVGGGALFFSLLPREAVLSDSNPELMNCYRAVQSNVEDVIYLLRSYPHNRKFFERMREKRPVDLSEVERAARLVYLNKTCYNGLYRVNKDGMFNVPFGSYKKPRICDAEGLRGASQALQGVTIEEGDFHDVLANHAEPGDFVYLDPPYYPVSTYSDFKRYTKEFFYEEDHVRLAEEMRHLVERGVRVLLTNSNAEFTRRLYQEFPYELVETRRYINSKGAGRMGGQDLIVLGTQPPRKTLRKQQNRSETVKTLGSFPGTRFMGSKYNVLDLIWESVRELSFTTVLDAFAGSGCVSYMFKNEGKRVFANDFLHFSYHICKALIENSHDRLDDQDLALLLEPAAADSKFIQTTFRDLYFTDEENAFLDRVRANIELLQSPNKRSLGLASLTRACLKKRPRGVFTYVGDRYGDDRPDLRMSLREHFVKAVGEFNAAVFDNGQANLASNSDVFALDGAPDLVYFDPPYFSPHSDTDYVRRYHFVEGLVRNWEGVTIQEETQTKKFRKYPTAFDGRASTYEGFRALFEKFKESIIVVSYSSNCLPSKSELAQMLKQVKKHVSVNQARHTYSFGTQYKGDAIANAAEEYVFVAT